MKTAAHITLVTGGARSGKSALAERLCARHPGPRIYIATAQGLDTEMSDRIAIHRARRGAGWRTVEAPRDLDAALRYTDGQGVRLVDCLTLWLANCGGNVDMGALTVTLRQAQSPVVIVTNELGGGIVPADAATRAFRDAHGWMNQAVAEVADQVWMAVCGQALRVKPGRDLEDDGL